jgi:hypothetical protein
MALRFHVVKQPGLLKRLEGRLVHALWRLQRATARRLGHEGTHTRGAVCFWQYFGSSPQLRALQTPLPIDLPKRPARRLATAHGFSLHADTAVHGNDRRGLERLLSGRGGASESARARDDLPPVSPHAGTGQADARLRP